MLNLYSPRGANVEGEDESWDFGTGAGFYLNATEPKWSNNYRMYEYITEVGTICTVLTCQTNE